MAKNVGATWTQNPFFLCLRPLALLVRYLTHSTVFQENKRNKIRCPRMWPTRGPRLALTSALVLAGLLLMCAPRGSALNPERHISQYGHTVWRTRDGAFDGMPVVVAQTSDGYLWIGTNLGLVRFDGAHFISWSPPSGQRLFDPRIFSILATRDGSLWIGTGYGVARLQNGKLTNYPQINGRIESLVEDADG